MQFIDHTGHLFSIKSYDEYPVGYEYETNPYIFWLDNEYTHKLSVNNYYILPIRPLINKTVNELSIKVESDVYSLIGSVFDNIQNYAIELDNDNIKKSLNTDDITIISGLCDDNDYEFSMIPFYVLGNASEEASWLSNVLIYIKYSDNTEEWCPITVGGVFINECEELVINGHNMGINIPKDILKAVYQSSYYNSTPDEGLFNDKMKEYLMNFMQIRGELGNYDSAIKSLKWFGYGDKIEITRLLQTDNQFLNQYIHDYFNITSDIIDSYKYFRNSTFIALQVKENQETDNINRYDWNSDFIGEGKPVIEDLFDKSVTVHYDENDIDFYKPYYNYIFDEMLLKITCLKQFYQKYFLPIHLNIHSAAIIHQVFANDIKMIYGAHEKLTECPVMMGNLKYDVKFSGNKSYFIYNQRKIVDTNLNEFEHYNEEYGGTVDIQLLLIDDPCISIPIYFKENTLFYCNLILCKDNKKLFETKFEFYNKNNYTFKNFIIYPKYILNNFNINQWKDTEFTIKLLANDIWYEHNFIIKVPEFHLNIGRLQYNYFDIINNTVYNFHKQINKITDTLVDFNAFMYIPSIANANDINFIKHIENTFIMTDEKTQTEVERQIIKSLYYNYGIINESAIQLSNKLTISFKLNTDSNLLYYTTGNAQIKVNIRNSSGIKSWETFDIENDETVTFDYYMADTERLTEYILIDITINRQLKMLIDNKNSVFYKYLFMIKPHASGKSICTCECIKNCIHKEKQTDSDIIKLDENCVGDDSVPVLKDINKNNIYSNIIISQIKELINYYRNDINIIKNDKYLNNIAVYYIYDSKGELFKFDYDTYYDNYGYQKSTLITLYRKFFNDDGKCKLQSICEDPYFRYDFYLMHDNDYWYGVFISDNTCNNMLTVKSHSVNKEFSFYAYNEGNNKNIIIDETYIINNTDKMLYENDHKYKSSDGWYIVFKNDHYYNANENGTLNYGITANPVINSSTENSIGLPQKTYFKFKFNRSDKEFLINRMMFIDSAGINHFNQDDIIIASVDNINFPYVMSQGSQWRFSKLSIDNYNGRPVYSKGNAAILSIENENVKYKPGYYNIDVRYSLDGYTNHQDKKIARIRISKNI